MKAMIPFAALAAFVLLHQDAWLWNDAGLVFGFMPSGLAYHAGYSIATAVLWAAVIWRWWPEGLAVPEAAPDSGEGRPQ